MKHDHLFHQHQLPTYQHFLNQDVVLSQPLSFHWIQQVVLFPNPISLKQKLPLKVYLGASFDVTESSIGSCHVFDSYTNTFEERAPELFIPQLGPLQELLRSLFPERPVRLSFLCDTAPGRGLCFFQSIATLIATLYLLEGDLWTIADIGKTRHNPEHLAELLGKAQEIYQTLSGDHTAGMFDPAGTIAGYSPILCKNRTLIPIETFSPAAHPPTQTPFHLALIYSGKASHAALIDQRAQKLYSTLTTAYKERSPIYTPPTRQDPVHTTQHYLQQMTADMVDIFLAIREDGALSEHIDRLFALFDMSLAHLRFLSELHPQMLQLVDDLRRIQSHHPSAKIGFSPIGTTKLGGSIIVSFTEKHIGAILEDFIHKERQKGYSYTLEYLSTRDLPSLEEGIQIPTYRQKNIYSTAPLDQLHVKRLSQQGTISSSHANNLAYDQLRFHSDLFLDTVEKKIYINGQKLTAKEIPTQAATLQVFEALFNSPTLSLASDQLPKSSYSSSKNEMASKVLIPLKRIVKAVLDKELHVEARGSITDFIVTLYPSTSFEIVMRVK